MSNLIDFIKPVTKNNKCSLENNISSITQNIIHPTEICLVFSDGIYHGIVSPHALFRNKKFLPQTSIAQVLIKPPEINLETSLFEIARLMASEHIYMLPVLEGIDIIGTVSIEDIKSIINSDQEVKAQVINNIRVRQIISISEKDSVRQALSLIKNESAEWIVVTNEAGNAIGLYHVGHILQVLLADDNKQRFGKNGIDWTNWSFDNEGHQIIDNQFTHLVKPLSIVSIPEVESEQIVNELSKPNIFAVVTTQNKVISGMVTIQDLAQAYSNLDSTEKLNIIIKKPSNSVDSHEFLQTQEDLNRFFTKMNNRIPIQRIEVSVEEPKYSTQETVVYNTSINVIPFTKGYYHASGSDQRYSLSVRNALDQIEKQHRRDHVLQNQHRNTSISEVTRIPETI